MSQAEIAFVNPRILRWAREEAGLSLEEAAKSILHPDKLANVENEEDHLTFKQFLSISKRYRRNPSFFYLKEPPDESLPRDFRTIKSGEIQFSAELRHKIQVVIQKREFAVEFKAYDVEYNYSFISSINLDMDPQEVAEKILDQTKLGVQNRNWKDKYQALNGWISKFEELGILVFQISGIEVQQLRGFCIPEIPYPTIGINRKDSQYGRIFTLLHEFVHLMLNTDAICTYNREDEKNFQIERFCNRVASLVLLPVREVENHPVVKDHDFRPEWSENELHQLQRTFWASKEAILIGLLDLNRTNQDYYQKMKSYWENLPVPKKGGPESPADAVLRKNPKNFIKIVLSAMYESNITLAEASQILNIGVKHFRQLEEKLEG